MYDARNKGASGGGNSGGTATDSADYYIQSAINSISQYLPKKVTPYEEVNPFFFDEALATKASTAEYEPYYKDLLDQYTQTVERNKSRSQEDLTSTLKQLEAGKEYYMGVQRRALDKATKNTDEGYAGRGLFFSGVRPNEIKELNTEYGAQTGNYLQNYDYNTGQANLTDKRLVEDQATNLTNYTKDTERSKQYAIQAGVLQRKGETQDEYLASKSKYYENALNGIV